MKVCSIDGCEGKVLARGWCSSHYWRWHDHGDPLGGSTNRGDVTKWMRGHVGHLGDDCLIFPYSRAKNGYGSVGFEGRVMGAHRAMCIMAHGQPPTKGMVAAHSCGRGAYGCVNPKHLRWATPHENLADAALHHELGISAAPSRKVSSGTAVKIAALRRKEPIAVTAKRFGIGESMVSRIQNGSRHVNAEKVLAQARK